MKKTIEALETLDEYDDSDYNAYLVYIELKDQCMIEPSVLYISCLNISVGLVSLPNIA